MTDRIAAGRAVYARNFGVTEAEAERSLTSRVGTDFTQETFSAAGGLGWQSESLTDRDRSIAVVVAALVAQNVTDERLITYLTLARRNSVDERGLATLMVLLTAYVGQPYNVGGDRGGPPLGRRGWRFWVTAVEEPAPSPCFTYDNRAGRRPGRVIRAMSAVLAGVADVCSQVRPVRERMACP